MASTVWNCAWTTIYIRAVLYTRRSLGATLRLIWRSTSRVPTQQKADLEPCRRVGSVVSVYFVFYFFGYGHRQGHVYVNNTFREIGMVNLRQYTQISFGDTPLCRISNKNVHILEKNAKTAERRVALSQEGARIGTLLFDIRLC